MSVKTVHGENKVVDLSKRRSGNADAAFGASISRGTERALPANEQALGILDKLVVDDSLPLYVAALDGTVIHMNDHYFTLDSLLGNVNLVAGPANEATGKRIPSLQPVIEDVLANDSTVRAEEVVNVGSAERVFLGRHIPIRNEQGSIVAVAGTYEDVTRQVRGVEEAQRTQAMFQDFARASSDWFFECGDDLKIRTLSDRFTAIVGQPSSLFIGSKFEQFGKFEKNLSGKNEGSTSIGNRKPFRDQLFIISGPDGKKLKFHLSGVPVFDRKTGDFTGYRGVGMDVTDRYVQAAEAEKIRENLETLLKELTLKNMALDDATEQATTALKAKNEFLAAMSHELRTPLNAIIGFAESFEGQAFGPLDTVYMNYAKDIRNSGQHLLALINDILDVAVVESGGLTLQLDNLYLSSVLEKAVHMNIDAARNKGLDTSRLETDTDIMINADDRRTTQIFVNLLSNAIKFTQEGGAIGIEITKNTTKGLASITVWDTGVGIAEENQHKVFEKFQQVTDHVYSRKQEGTGLGMHISQQLARKMGGDITLESIEGEGSRFTLTMPLADKASLDEDDMDFI
ncbi:hypothetical protein GCM10017044_19810 [Kordiimonas sediminis]|uniref:histidine kinase n=1 Tax=Kordiimonas sediminis TaxID=1735581 RepID=A0A919ASP9_9PROT|nr:PAS domain-containing sensor histidine kinase [Kordiimonas sediminis]GHF25071.1 hypothetical protein GCM10017044_19810 [Kordiimonas sediminis]